MKTRGKKAALIGEMPDSAFPSKVSEQKDTLYTGRNLKAPKIY